MFDLDRLAEEVGWGIVEWSELRDGFLGRDSDSEDARVLEDEWLTEEERRYAAEGVRIKDVEKMGEGVEPESLGCWSSWMSTNGGSDLGMNDAMKYYNLSEFDLLFLGNISRVNYEVPWTWFCSDASVFVFPRQNRPTPLSLPPSTPKWIAPPATSSYHQ